MIVSFKMALRSISSNKLRACLTMLGIIIGVMALVVLVSLVNGATSSVTDAVSGLGTSMLTVSISDDKGLPLDLDTVNGLMEEEGVGLVAPYISSYVTAKQDDQEDGPKASILSNTVSTGSINTELIGGGTLAEEDAVTTTVPAEVKLKEFLVSNGQTVTEGTPIASVDRVTVMTAISEVQETLEYLSEEIREAGNESTTEKVNAMAGGIVKIMYAEEGESVQRVMLEHGALAVLSLDGLMAVDLETESALAVGTTVTVTLSDGTQVAGKIARNLAGEMTVTVADAGYAVGDAVQIAADDGTSIGSGELYIYNPWNATAYAGTVDSIKVSIGDKLSAGKTLMVLSDVGYSAAYRQLISQRQEYEDLMLDLFEMYQTETVTAPCDGVVSGIDQDSVQLLSDKGRGFVLTFLSNAPNGNDETAYTNYVGKVTAVGQNGWSLLVNPQPVQVTDYKDLSGVNVDERAMTQVCTYPEVEQEETPAPEEPVQPQISTVPVYELVEGSWQQIAFSSVGTGDILLFAADGSGEFVWIVRIQKSEGSQGEPDIPDRVFPSGGMGETEPVFEPYSLELAEIAAVTPQNTMTMEITIDELDIRQLEVGMTAEVKIDALGGEKYTAVITEIGNTGTNNGGNSKYTVELTMDRAENMLSGMNATATIVLSTVSDVLTIPADALVENGNQTLVYTGYDEENNTLINPVPVKVGICDGETAQILDGLTAGQTYYYAYYDTLEISYTPDLGGGFPFG